MAGANKKIAYKLYSLVALASLGIIITSFIMISDIKSAMYDGKKTELKSLAETAYSIMAIYQKKVESGALDKAKAQSEAMKLIQDLRYDKNQYFWINDTHPKMIMHPTQPAMNGQDLSEIKDPDGKKFFVEFAQVAKETASQEAGGGFVEYYFQKPTGTDVFPKVSFVKLFEPWGWVIGTGVYIDDLQAKIWSNSYKIGGIAGFLLIAIAVASLMITRNITRPVQQITDVMLQLTNGNTSVDVPNDNRSDEFGEMQKALLIFKKNVEERQRLENMQSQQKEASDFERKQAFSRMAENFESSIKSVIDTVSNAALRMKQDSGSMVSTVSDNVARTETISHASEEASANVETVASAAEQMASSIHDISSKVSESSRIAKTAVEEIHRTNEVVKGLAEASEAIGEIVNLIQDIAEQTNLLALNATIEAARAGDAGKGFAVVASEVKNLANQTSKATEQIAQQISSIQGITDNAVSAIGGIGATIDRMNSISGTIASAIEEQGIATREISANMGRAATGTRDVTQNVVALNKSTKSYGETANEVSNSAQELNKQVEVLQGQVNDFVRNIRRA